MVVPEKIQTSVERLKEVATDKAQELKSNFTDQVEKIHELVQKDYSIFLSVEKDGVKRIVKTNRPTKRIIKWQSKGH
ncbi:hypothetical protein SAMN02745116_01296 [Pilibacter termitis]|uniref:Uncharacterized protein n=1 Tax=Pilibacter termitis TaxID=263852 RepID=A0A1T4N4J0_9ENTE|nr:hypothetical protein [Pilibacter termitis]SJZ73987.1 hypothetical protein SAMN02745116_01296 [Pilibacter termitis]